jgi:hypothetical protein
MSILRLLHWIVFFDYEPWLEINGAAGSGSVRLDGRFELCLKRDNGDAEKASNPDCRNFAALGGGIRGISAEAEVELPRIGDSQSLRFGTHKS